MRNLYFSNFRSNAEAFVVLGVLIRQDYIHTWMTNTSFGEPLWFAGGVFLYAFFEEEQNERQDYSLHLLRV